MYFKGTVGKLGFIGIPGDKGRPGPAGPPGLPGFKGIQGSKVRCSYQNIKIKMKIKQSHHKGDYRILKTFFSSIKGERAQPGRKGNRGAPGKSVSLILILTF